MNDHEYIHSLPRALRQEYRAGATAGFWIGLMIGGLVVGAWVLVRGILSHQ